MSLGFSYCMLSWHHSFQLERKTNTDKRIQCHVTIVITVCNHYVNIDVLSHIPLIPMSSKPSLLPDSPPSLNLSKMKKV